jgi:hypothetical protein
MNNTNQKEEIMKRDKYLVLILIFIISACTSKKTSDDLVQTAIANQVNEAKIQTAVAETLLAPSGVGQTIELTNTPQSLPVSTPTVTPNIKFSLPTPGISKYFWGNALPNLPNGDLGNVSVIFYQKSFESDSSVDVIVRNNSQDYIKDISITSSVYSSDGKLYGTGSSQGFVPKLLASGEFAIGYAYFSDVILPNDATYKFDIRYYPATASTNSGDLLIVNPNIIENRIVGFAQNPNSTTVGGPISIELFCFDENNNYLYGGNSFLTSFADESEVTPQSQIPFQATVVRTCPKYLISLSGFSW